MSVVSEESHNRGSLGRLLSASFRQGSAVWLLGLFILLFSITAPGTFPTLLTVQIVLSDQVSVALLALAILIPLAGGNFDFSVGTLLALSLAVSAVLTKNGMGVVSASIIAIAVTSLCGFISGFIVVKLHVNSFIATMGVSQIATAITYLITQNLQVIPTLPYEFIAMTHGKLLGLNFDVYYLFGIGAILWFVLEHTPAGRGLFAAGGNREAARLAGVRVDVLNWASLVCSGAISGIAGVLLLSKAGFFTQEFGNNFLFAAFAAVFFGATQIKGRYNVWGTLLALYVLSTAVAGLQLTFTNNEYWITPLFNGVALLIAVSLATRRHAGKIYRKMRKGTAVPPDSVGDDQESGPAIPVVVERG